MAYKRDIEGLDLDGFLGHKAVGGGGSFLKNWKENGSVVVWLHPKALIAPLWHHTWYTVGKDRETQAPKIRTIRFNSMERESVLRRYQKRDKNGVREAPPEICPFSLFLEWLYQQIDTGAINWTDEIFNFDEGDDPVVLHAGGMLGMFTGDTKDFTAEEMKDLKRIRVSLSEGFKESCLPRMQYVFRVVNDEDPGSGCLIALESASLGKAVQTVISDRIDDVGREKGDPFKYPYAIKWVYDEKQSFSRKYAARALLSREMPEEVRAALEQDPPSIDELTAPSNIWELQQSMEAHWVHKGVTPPWEEFFAKAREELGESEETQQAAEDPADFPFGANAPASAGDNQIEEIECDVCKAVIRSDQFECPHCKTRWDEKTSNIVYRGAVNCEVCSNEMPAGKFECEHCGTVYNPKNNQIMTRGEWPKSAATPRTRRGR